MGKILNSFKLYSHPDKLLKDHLINVYDIGISLLKELNNPFLKKDMVQIILLFHDFGKASKYFQNKLFKKENQNEALTRHSGISALFCLYYLLQVNTDTYESLLAYLAIKKHHGNLNENLQDLLVIDEYTEENIMKIVEAIDLEEMKQIYGDCIQYDLLDKELFLSWFFDFKINVLRRLLENQLKKNNNLVFYTRLNAYFSVLVYADKQDCIFDRDLLKKEQPVLAFDSVDIFIKNNFMDNSEINNIRNQAYKEVDQNVYCKKRILSINLPTGTGKTLIALNSALKLLEKDVSLDKIIYCLPFTSVIDQNADVFEKVLHTDDANILLKQHHLVDINTSKYDMDNQEITDNQAEYLIETWNSKIIVTTFYQLLHTLLSGSNRLLKKFNKLCNAVIILDEVQSIPRKYWELINNVLTQSAELLNMRIILVTATMPMIFSEEKEEIKELAVSKQTYFSALNRIALNVSVLINKTSIDDFCKIAIDEIKTNSKKSFLIILNTINSSLEVYKALKAVGLEPIYLSSNVIPKHRLDRIAEIKKAVKRQVVVSTQVVEAGVDIDFDIVFRDIAPLDSIFQACGRCNRNSRNGVNGIVKIFDLYSNEGKSFAKYIYDDVSLSKTKEILCGKSVIEENCFYQLAVGYYDLMKNATETTTSNNLCSSMKLLKYFDAFYGRDCFELIKNNYKTMPVYVVMDDISKKLLEDYSLLTEQLMDNRHDFNFKVSYKKHIRKMQKYMLSIPAKYIKMEKQHNFYIINQAQIPHEYNPVTGFVRSPQTEDYFM